MDATLQQKQMVENMFNKPIFNTILDNNSLPRDKKSNESATYQKMNDQSIDEFAKRQYDAAQAFLKNNPPFTPPASGTNEGKYIPTPRDTPEFELDMQMIRDTDQAVKDNPQVTLVGPQGNQDSDNGKNYDPIQYAKDHPLAIVIGLDGKPINPTEKPRSNNPLDNLGDDINKFFKNLQQSLGNVAIIAGVVGGVILLANVKQALR
jgi:hypothetical protein